MDIKAMSSFCMYRMTDPIANNTVEKYYPIRKPIDNSADLFEHLKKRVSEACASGKTALALSGGIDSAILAKFMPKGSTAYTFKCVVPGIEVTDESPMAAKYAKECGLVHKVIEIYWEDYLNYSKALMEHKKEPIHSIEVQIHKAALKAKEDGFDTLIFGEAADAVYGGLNGLLSKDWKLGDFIDRYSFVLPHHALFNPDLVLEPFYNYAKDGIVDPHEFISHVFINESVGSYFNAAETAGVNLLLPYPETYLLGKIDYTRIRSGENKYLVREVFKKLYPDFDIPPKKPMHRPMNEWLKDWDGPKRPEFIPNCIEGMTGDQKWVLWSLEYYLNMIEK